jgi:hypothetical protein
MSQRLYENFQIGENKVTTIDLNTLAKVRVT